MISFFVGLFIGGFLGLVVTALCCASKTGGYTNGENRK